jgi:hypothetical protein
MPFCLPLWVAARVLKDSSPQARVAACNVNAAKKIEAAVSDQILLFMLRVSFAAWPFYHPSTSFAD